MVLRLGKCLIILIVNLIWDLRICRISRGWENLIANRMIRGICLEVLLMGMIANHNRIYNRGLE